MLANAGIRRVCYGEFYRDERIFNIAKKLKIELVKLGSDDAASSNGVTSWPRNGSKTTSPRNDK